MWSISFETAKGWGCGCRTIICQIITCRLTCLVDTCPLTEFVTRNAPGDVPTSQTMHRSYSVPAKPVLYSTLHQYCPVSVNNLFKPQGEISWGVKTTVLWHSGVNFSADSVPGESCYSHSISNAGIYSGLGNTLQFENPCLASKINLN